MIGGTVTIKDATAQGIIVLNLVNENETVTNKQGQFSILASIDDVLVFSAVHLDYQRKIIEQQDFDSGSFTIAMTSKINQLDEVRIIEHKGINAVALGILSKPAKQYSPAERRLKTANSFDFTPSYGFMMGGAMSIDPIINAISGRTKLLKSELKIEKRELLLKKLDALYATEYYTERLKIPKQFVTGFKYYCIEDKQFAQTLVAKNKTMTGFLMNLLATEYNFLSHE